ncbi:MAG: hypothetical protein AAGA32_01790 [Pseudomonadota bacterium]
MVRILRSTAVIVSVWLAAAAILLLPDGLYITGHDGDLIHMLDLVARWAEGERPHIDFMTPLGALSIWPFAAFVEAGYGPGTAFRLSQSAVTLALLPAILWTVWSRLEGTLATVVGVGLVLLSMALVFGGTVPSISISMYYNRWAWALAALIVLLIFLPARPGWRAPLLDGVLIGMAGAVLVLLKVTYAVALLPFALVAVLHDRAWAMLAGTLIGALSALAVATVTLGGVAFWQAYLGDLILVSTAPLRPFPGEDLGMLLGGPSGLPASMLLLLIVVFWRKTRRAREGMLLLFLAPGWVYITFQNWGNDPKWLALLAVLLVAVPAPERARPFFGQPAARAGGILAVVSLVLIAPSMSNIAMSGSRHLLLDKDGFAPIFDDIARSDILVMVDTHRRPSTQGRLAEVDFGPPPDMSPEPVVFLGEELGSCQTVMGLVGWLRKATDQLGAIEEAVGRSVLSADLLDAMWLFGPFERIPGQGPWYYGSDRGFDAADYVLVPLCPMSGRARRIKLALIEEAGWEMREVVRTDLFILAERVR